MPVIGDLLAGRYRVDARLGAGGMGTVWRAHDLRLDRDVAVKILMPSLAGDPVLAQRFDREARALAAVASAHVVAIYDVVTSAGSDPFLVMELCPDGSLGDRLDAAGSMPVAQALPLLADAAEGLMALHGRGILHRDVTPRNVLLSGSRAKLGDLGLARPGALDERIQVTELTAVGTTVGTLAYLAPELLEGEPPSPASDVYGLGAVTYRTLTGVLPHAAGNVAELVTARMEPVAALGYRLPGVEPGLASLVAQCLDVRPSARPTAAALAFGLRNLAAARVPGRAIAAPVADPDAPTRSAITIDAGTHGRGDGPRAAEPLPARSGRGSARYSGPSLWTGELLLIAIVVGIVLLALAALAGVFRAAPAATPGPTGPQATAASAAPSSPQAPSPSPALSPSSAPSPSLSLPTAQVPDPFADASARVADLRAAIEAAKGPGALKGNEAKKLGDLLDGVAGALTERDAAAARTATDRVAAQVQAYISDGRLSGDPAQSLVTAVLRLKGAISDLP